MIDSTLHIFSFLENFFSSQALNCFVLGPHDDVFQIVVIGVAITGLFPP